MTLGDRIRAAIDAKDLKDNWVADGAGISTTTLSNIIRGFTQDPSVSVIADIADVLGESVDALLGRPGHPLLQEEQQTLREAAALIVDRVLPPPKNDNVAARRISRRKPKRTSPAIVSTVFATPNKQFFTDVREVRRFSIPTELRDRGVRRAFRVDGDSMIDAGIQSGDVLFVRTEVMPEEANGRIVVCRHVDDESVKRLEVHADGRVTLHSANDRYLPVTLSVEQAKNLFVYGIVVSRLTDV
ncbi:MAG TPA: LexA family transcriptional regulator [Thermoanaerobaculia bacterium]|nr:LexA family transcriptional regulator [Thermoanaerobaculia bacterium]